MLGLPVSLPKSSEGMSALVISPRICDDDLFSTFEIPRFVRALTFCGAVKFCADVSMRKREAKEASTLAANAGSAPIAEASSPIVSRLAGAPLTRSLLICAIAALTKAVLAATMLLFPASTAGTDTGPPNTTLPVRLAFRSKAACVAVDTGLARSLVLSTLPRPISALAPDMATAASTGLFLMNDFSKLLASFQSA